MSTATGPFKFMWYRSFSKSAEPLLWGCIVALVMSFMAPPTTLSFIVRLATGAAVTIRLEFLLAAHNHRVEVLEKEVKRFEEGLEAQRTRTMEAELEVLRLQSRLSRNDSTSMVDE